MIPPKKILTILSEHWPLIETLIRRFNMADFNIHDVQTILKTKYPTWPGDKIFKEANRLLNHDILIPLAKSSQLELNRAVAEFAQYLLQEESLGIAEEVHVLIRDLARLGHRLAQAGQDNDFEELRRNCRIMDERVRKIVKLFYHNENAILNIVEQAKADHSQRSLEKRYQAVIEAFDLYIEPMLEMVDIGGEFKACFSEIEQQISTLLEQIQITGKLFSEKRMLEQLRTRILDMHLTGRESLRKSADMLMPLREELRRNTLLTRQAAKVLGAIRKNGVDAVLSAHQPHITSDQQKFSLGTAHQMVAYMAHIDEFEQEEYQLPDQSHVPAFINPNIPDFFSVKTRFTADLGNKQTGILAWLDTQYPELEADELLFLYQKMANDPDLTVTHSAQPSVIALADCQFKLHPYHASLKTTSLKSN
ncbi:hypothetical protein [Pseudoalteromonas tunicata]|nr:hypothetical protein [Pseudoalteromonas tunicata]ATC95178.1 hypothetical protein PTUN_a2744 [Pseudoalteromonas tunicata]AXT30792.1 hypothetical protein D1819_08240 [Pseudoalteromonas tunicata]